MRGIFTSMWLAGSLTLGWSQGVGEKAAVFLTANEMSIATGTPSLVVMSKGSVHVPVWSMSGGTVGQSIVGVATGLPEAWKAVKVEVVVTTSEAESSSQFEDVYRVHLSQLVDGASSAALHYQGSPIRTRLPDEVFQTRNIVLDPFYAVEPGAPLVLRVQREPSDPADTFLRPTGIAAVKLTPVEVPTEGHVVQDVKGYNSWPMMQAIGNKLVCVYSRGSGHTIGEDSREVFAKTSTDNGKTWTKETLVASTPGYGEVAVGKGLDENGAMLLWVRRVGKDWHQDLYRTTDGITFEKISTPELQTRPVQITDVFSVPTVGLMSLWFGGSYNDEPNKSWGTVISKDNGMTWTQHVVESGLTKADWPTEPSAVYLGDGKIFCVARTELGGPSTDKSQFQIVSTDYGVTWKRSRTNISDVTISTPSLILDPETGLVSNYYYHRGKGILRRRVVDPVTHFDRPLDWPPSEAVTVGSEAGIDAGNVNATVIGRMHYLSFYSGKAPDTRVMVSEVAPPAKAGEAGK